MRILGIDPGTGRLGWSIIDVQSQNYTLVDVGCFETKVKEKLEKRLTHIYGFINYLLEKYNPDEVSTESLFFTNNAKTAFDVGAARGVVLLSCEQHHKLVTQYTPSQVKLSLTGYGKAEKPQIQFMVAKILKLTEAPKPDDAADACAIALTHAFNTKTLVINKAKNPA